MMNGSDSANVDDPFLRCFRHPAETRVARIRKTEDRRLDLRPIRRRPDALRLRGN
jgi:hypothetical protein